MKHLKQLLTSSENTPLQLSFIEKQFIYIDHAALQLHLEFSDDNAEMVLTNHLISLCKRIQTKQLVADMDAEMFAQISEEAMEMARLLTCKLFLSNALLVSQTEVLLVATHMQLYLENKKGENKNG